MFVSIRFKLFALIIVANGLMVAALLTINAVSFSRSFSDYIVKQESSRLETLIQNIAAQYEQTQNWAWLSWDDPIMQDIIGRSLSFRELGDIARFDRAGRTSGAGNGPGPRPNNPPPQGSAGRGFDNDTNPAYLNRLVITESDRNTVLLGRNAESATKVWLAITSTRDNSVLGYLGFEPSTRLNNEFDRVFADQQQRQIIIIGLLGFLSAGLLAIPFSGWLVRPVRKMTSAVRSMTDGDLSVSIDKASNDELGQLANDFNRLAVSLKKSQQDRQQWVSDIAHELRTPVALLQADIEAAQDGVRQVSEQWLQYMYSHSDRLARLVNDLHQLSQSDAGALSYRFDSVSVTDVLNSVVAQFEKSLVEHHIRLSWRPTTAQWRVRGDEQRLTQLFANLLQNTVRYTDGSQQTPGHLVINVEQVNNNVHIHWLDSSPGVGDDDLPKLFDRLYRVDESRSRQSGGSGLGLAIVKNIIQAHDGCISAHHSDLGGLKITVILPLYRESTL